MRYGYFDNENFEYVIERPNVPVSWTNYLGVKDLCTVISHNAGGYSFYKSAEHHRITRFRQNGVPLDRPGHYVYIRDDDTGEYWSISWQPVGKISRKRNINAGMDFHTRNLSVITKASTQSNCSSFRSPTMLNCGT